MAAPMARPPERHHEEVWARSMGFEGSQVSDDRRDWEEVQNGKREERKMFLGVYWEGFSVSRDKAS